MFSCFLHNAFPPITMRKSTQAGGRVHRCMMLAPYYHSYCYQIDDVLCLFTVYLRKF
jgi:hypothetical protein